MHSFSNNKCHCLLYLEKVFLPAEQVSSPIQLSETLSGKVSLSHSSHVVGSPSPCSCMRSPQKPFGIPIAQGVEPQ